jgi:hypothetical protein
VLAPFIERAAGSWRRFLSRSQCLRRSVEGHVADISQVQRGAGVRRPAVACLSASAGDKKGDNAGLAGTWGNKDGELKIEFAGKDTMRIAPHGDSAIIAIVCDYTVAKAGLVQAKVTGFEGKEQAQKKIAELLPVGSQFSFKWSAKGDSASLADVTGKSVEILKSHLEGDFEKK